MVVPPPLADLRHPAERWQSVFASRMLLAGKSVQNADRCDIQATVSAQADEFPPIERVFFATPRNEKADHPTFGWSDGTVLGACDATRTPTSYPTHNRPALFNVR
jgi:hypothetical protein